MYLVVDKESNETVGMLMKVEVVTQDVYHNQLEEYYTEAKWEALYVTPDGKLLTAEIDDILLKDMPDDTPTKD